MSKIYEALRQAELDRAAGVQTQPEPTPRPAAVAAAVLDVPPAQPQWTPPRAEQDEAAPAHALVVAAAPALPPVAPLDLSAIPTCAWHPSYHLLPSLEERGAAVEQFRSLRSRMYEFRDLGTLKSIIISSGLPQEGKSFVAVNLAISFARHKAARVLLIDGDMRRPSQHKILGTSVGPGLTEYLAGKASLLDVLQRPAPSETAKPLPQGIASLTFISGGHEGEKAADLSGNARFRRLMEEVSPHFDWIVVDTSPVNLVSDGVNLSHACDGVLLIARGAVTRYTTAQRALTELKASKILGFVLNAIHNPIAGGGYYGYDGYDKELEQ